MSYTSQYTGPQVDEAIENFLSGTIPIDLGFSNPEGLVSANPRTFGYGSDGSLWYKYSGTSNIGWTQVVTDQNLDIIGGSF